MSGVCICLGQPTLPDLQTYLYDVIDWKVFASHLLPSKIAATEIETISRNHPNDLKECKIQLYTVFFRQGTCTWERIVEALEKSKYPRIAQKIKRLFCKTN